MNESAIPSQEMVDQFVGNAHGNLSMVKEMLDKYPSLINANASWTETAIGAAAQTGQVDIVNYLLSQGAEYDISTAAMLGNLDCIQEYLMEDPNLINARGAHDLPLLYFPVIHAKKGIAEFLLSQGADPNAASPTGITPLHGTVMFNQPGMARWLLENGAMPNPLYDGQTPLTMAIKANLEELIKIFRSHGGIE
jgi:ankyrin repeat protein